MIVVDTSVWIDVLNQRDTPQARRCVELLEDGAPLALTDVVSAEILQGFRSEREARSLARYSAGSPSSASSARRTSSSPPASTDAHAAPG